MEVSYEFTSTGRFEKRECRGVFGIFEQLQKLALGDLGDHLQDLLQQLQAFLSLVSKVLSEQAFVKQRNAPGNAKHYGELPQSL